MKKAKEMIVDAQGRVMVPILMYLLGVPGLLCILIWAFFFRGK